MDRIPDAYAALRATATALEAEGVPDGDIIDALFRLAVLGATAKHGHEAVSFSLHDMAALVAGGAPTTTH